MAVVRRIGFTRFSRWGVNLGRLDVTAAAHAEALDGTDEIKVACSDDVGKGDYVVWIDARGVAHEHIVDDVSRTHGDDGVLQTEFTGVNSIAELWDDWTDDVRPSGQVATALSRVLSATRWTVGTCDVSASANAVLYHQSARESVADIVAAWGGELETSIETNGSAVTARKVGVRSMRGDQSSPKRFTWTKDIKSITRTVSGDNPKTRVFGYGKGVETDGGGYGRRLTFGSINGGMDYVEDVSATAVWGRPDGAGGVLPSVGSYVNEQCEDAAQLLRETRDYLERAKEPKVSYTASVVDLYAFGRSWEGVGVGDGVSIIDKGFSDEGVRLRGRVSKIERDLITGDATVTFGTLTDAMADMWQSVSSALKGNSQQNALYDAASGTSVSWLRQLQAALNDQFNAVGTYKVETFEIGTIWSNVPIDAETGLPVKPSSDMWAVNINGAGMRLASSLDSAGRWNWRTFLTGAQVSADAINTGTLSADLVRTGSIEGKNVLIDLDNGDVTFQKGSIRSSNGNLDIDIDSGSMSVVNGSDEGVFFRNGDMQLTSRSFFDGGENAMYGEITRDGSILSGNNRGVTVEGSSGAAIKSSNSELSSLSHAGLIGYVGEGAACAVNANGEAFLGGKKSFSVGSGDGQYVSSGSNGIVQVGKGLYVWGTITALGDFTAIGTKSAVVRADDGMRRMYAYELTENWFGDLGFSETGGDCRSFVGIDPVFSQAVNIGGYPYHVFLTPETDARVWVERKEPAGFTVGSDSPHAKFSYEIKARRMGFEKDRMELSDIPIDDIDRTISEQGEPK